VILRFIIAERRRQETDKVGQHCHHRQCAGAIFIPLALALRL